jgi:hypothetical protein
MTGMSRLLLPLLLASICSGGVFAEHKPLALHPENPHYFLFRDRPAVLITSGEHYGAVLNLDFDCVRYLDTLKSHGFNLTRTFSGTYREVPGSFNITGNTLAPAAGRFVCPWTRSDTPGAFNGGSKFDLTRWDEAYFRRLKHFVKEAGERGIVVELVLFCTMYDDKLWHASPMNTRNNVNGIGKVGRGEVYALKEDALTASQEALTRHLVKELADFDNVYFEICNEPYERGGFSDRWNDRIVRAIVGAEKGRPTRHLIAQNVARGKIAKPNPDVSVFNFHAATPDEVAANYALNKALASDETGGSDRSDRKYRTEGWDFIMAGGGVYSHLDLSFTTDRPDGSAVPLPDKTPGGGGPEVRRQLQVLKEFMEGFDFVRIRPEDSVIKRVTAKPAGATARALVEAGKAYAIYVNGGKKVELVLDLPPGEYSAQWVNTKTGKVEQDARFAHRGGEKPLESPEYAEDVALRVLETREQ